MKTKLQADLTSAMRSKNALQLTVLRSLKASITNAEKAQGDTPLNDLEVLQIVRKEYKKRQDSMDAYETANRMDLRLKEFEEREILASYLPIKLTTEELDAIIFSAIEELQATSKKEMGKVIKRSLELSEGRVDNKSISQRVGELLK